MLVNLELFVQSMLLRLLEGKVQFYFVHSVFNFLEDPSQQSYLTISKFSKNAYDEIKHEIEALTPQINQLKAENPNFVKAFHFLISSTLYEYSYTFKDKNNIIIQSNLLFLMIKNLPNTCLTNLCNYLCDKDLSEAFSFPQICSSSYAFSTPIHELLHKKLDDIAFRCASCMENKATLFTLDVNGDTPLDVAIEQNCELSSTYLTQLKKIGEKVGIFKAA